VIILDVEDYVQPADLEKALKAGHLWDRVYTPDLTKPLPTMLDLVNPIGGKIERKQRVIVTSENHGHAAPWLIGSYDLMQETPYTFTAINQFNCRPNRGAARIRAARQPLATTERPARSGEASRSIPRRR
jgi:hypothetical protein